MRATLSLVRREFSAYFLSPIAYAMLAVFLAVTGLLFYLSLDLLTARGPRGLAYPMQLLVNHIIFWLVFLFIPPLLTMRLFAEERATGTLEMLLTAPLRDWQIVLSKYFASFAFYVVMWLPTLLYLPILLNWNVIWENWTVANGLALLTGNGVAGWLLGLGLIGLVVGLVSVVLPVASMRWFGLGALGLGGVIMAAASLWLYTLDVRPTLIELSVDPWPVVTSYIGVALAGAMFLAIGMLISSLFKSQMVAALFALFIGLIFIIVGYVITGFWRVDLDSSGDIYRILYYFSIPLHFERNFSRGLIDTRQLVLYGSLALFCIFMTIRSLESRRWRS